MIFVDTNIWSQAFRKQKNYPAASECVNVLQSLIESEALIVIPGIVLQELLSGLREDLQFAKLRKTMAVFPVILATEDTHISAASITNTCRSAGITVSATDALISAMCMQHHGYLLTEDKDFSHIAHHCPLKLFNL